MDALRRAEADESPASATAEPAAAKDTAVQVSASTTPEPGPGPGPGPGPDSPSLQLEPMDSAGSSEQMLAETAAHDVANDGPATAETDAIADNDKSSRADAQRAVHSMATRRSSLRKQATYILTGLAVAGFTLAAYYLWQNNQKPLQQVPHSATLVTAPDTSFVQDATETVEAVVVEPTRQLVEGIPDKNASDSYQAPAAENFVEPAAATTASAPAPTTESTAYKIEIHKRSTPRAVPEQLKQAYQAYQSKDYQQAEQLYRKALRRYPGNQDAMLGLAAIALHNGNRRVAHHYYTQILKHNPGDKNSLLALQALNGSQHQLEHGSQIKHWLQSDPGSAPLHFALGNQHASNNRWKEAQEAYFEAYRSQPGNADYAFNLAVSLDQLGLKTEALNYYRIARKLSDGSAAQFSSSQLQRRINQLHDQVGQGS